MRIIFMGSSKFAINTLRKLIYQKYNIIAVYSQPPKPKGRGKKITKTPIHKFAESIGLKIFTPSNFKDQDNINIFIKHNATLAIIVAYGLLLPKAILESPVYGCLNLHASLLPKWRGSAPIQRSIMNGDKQTGLTIIQMNEKLDAGNICLIKPINIKKNITYGELHNYMATIGANLIIKALFAIEQDNHIEIPQNKKEVCYANKILKNETRINWHLPAQQLHNHIRGLSPFPGAWCEFKKYNKIIRIKILETKITNNNGKSGQLLDDKLTVACGEKSLQIIKLQQSGKKINTATEFQHGNFIAMSNKFI